MTSPVFAASEEIVLWVTDGAIHIKIGQARHDPVEMSEEEALELAGILTKLVEELRA